LLNSCGAEYFPALITALSTRRGDEVHLESYIFEDDATGRAVAAAMATGPLAAVSQVRVLVDGFGAPEFADRLQPGLVAAGVQAMIYRPDIARFPVASPSSASPAPQTGGDRWAKSPSSAASMSLTI
jgi:cardiolipin synthase